MNKYLSIFLILVLIVLETGIPSIFGTVERSSAASQGVLEPSTVIKEILPSDTTRITPYVTKKVLGYSGNDVLVSESISSVPITMSDLVTKIICEWRFGTDIDGVPYYITGNNLFSARVTYTRVSIQYNGSSCAWDPIISIGTTKLSWSSGPLVVDDPINPSYKENTIKWVYTCKQGGILGIGSKIVTVTRYLRQVEGSLLEYYVLDSNPNGDFSISDTYLQESKYEGESYLGAWDTDNKYIPVIKTALGKKVLADSFVGLKYPVWVDPGQTFDPSSAGIIFTMDSTWSGARDSVSGDIVSYPTTKIDIRSTCDSPQQYTITRSYVYFNTSSIPSTATLDSVTLGIRVSSVSINEDYTNLYVTGGMPTYPPDSGLISSSYDISKYTQFFGSIPYSSLSTSDYWYYINFDSGSLSSIPYGTAKFMLCTQRDWDNLIPIGENSVTIYSTGNSGPILQVTYTMPPVSPIVESVLSDPETYTSSSFTVSGYLDSLGGDPSCSVKFRYGLTSSFGQFTTSNTMYSIGSFEDTVSSNILQGTIYYYAAYGTNTVGSDQGVTETILTKPDVVVPVAITPGDHSITLNWTKGTGSTSTMVRSSTTANPTSISDGTLVYFGTGNSYINTGLVNGVTYYYSAWAYTTRSGLTQYSPYVSLGISTPVYAGPPTMETYSATGTTQISTILNGNLKLMNGNTGVDCYFYYAPVGDLNITIGVITKSSPGPYTYSLTGLTPNTVYNYWAVGNGDSYGQGEGSVVQFTTNSSSAPTVLTTSATAVTATSAVFNGKVVSDGNDLNSATTVWFAYGTTTSYGETTVPSTATTNNYVPVLVTDLLPGTLYHYQFMGNNSIGIGGGGDSVFTTGNPSIPVCTVLDATNIGATSVTLQGLVNSDGGANCSVEFEYGSTPSFGTETGWSPYTSITGSSFRSPVSGLSLYVTYYYRAKIKNLGGMSNSSVNTFTTQFSAPGSFTALATSPTTVLLSWVPLGDSIGIWTQTGAFPADRLTGTRVYFGTGSSITVGNLTPGTTYFFRAWSWSDLYSYSPGYSEDVATTPGQTGNFSVTSPSITVNLTTPVGYFLVPNGSHLSHWPGYGLIEDAATQSGIPAGSLWLIIVLVLSSVCGLITWRITGSLLFVLITIGVVMATASAMGLLPLWVLFAFILMGGSGAMILKNHG